MQWPEAFPPAVLRSEIEAMAEAWRATLEAAFPGKIASLRVKGSAIKRWDSPLDYVPELSDLDLHLDLPDEADVERIESMELAAAIRAEVARRYLEACPDALHLVRPQLTLVHRLHELRGYVESPPETVRTLVGPESPAPVLTDEVRASQRARDREALREHDAFVARLGSRLVDRPGHYAVQLLREMSWRVSPIAPRLLSIRGIPYEQAWVMNRTELIAALRAHGINDIAEAYESYYRHAWKAFLEGPGSDATMSTIEAGERAIRLGSAMARSGGS